VYTLSSDFFNDAGEGSLTTLRKVFSAFPEMFSTLRYRSRFCIQLMLHVGVHTLRVSKHSRRAAF
jgi:hypothetical protein